MALFQQSPLFMAGTLFNVFSETVIANEVCVRQRQVAAAESLTRISLFHAHQAFAQTCQPVCNFCLLGSPPLLCLLQKEVYAKEGVLQECCGSWSVLLS